MGAMPIASAAAAPSRAELVDHLVRTRIAGEVATPRENNLSHYRKLANGDRHYWFGLEFGDRWTDEQDVLAVMAERCGVIDDPHHRQGQDTIDPELTVDALDRAAAVLRKAAADGQRVLFATGHPGGLLDVHRATAEALRAQGCEVMVIPDGLQADDGMVFQFADVAMLERGATLWHTHSPEPMAAILDGLEREGPAAAGPGDRRPRLGGLRGPARHRRGGLRGLQRPGPLPRRGRGHPPGDDPAGRPRPQPAPLRPADRLSAGRAGLR